MIWTTPKTDWYGSTDENGVYTGDRFNAKDFNRIKNNLEFLRNLAIDMYKKFNITSLGKDRTPVDYFYADEINQLETNLQAINNNTLKRQYGSAVTYFENSVTMTFGELNRLETAILDLYDRLNNQSEGRRTFTWNFGMRGGEF